MGFTFCNVFPLTQAKKHSHRDLSSPSDAEKKRKKDKHKHKKDDGHRSRKDLPRNSEKTAVGSKLSFSPLCVEESGEEANTNLNTGRPTGTEVSLKIHGRKLSGLWSEQSSEDETAKPKMSSPPEPVQSPTNGRRPRNDTTSPPKSNGKAAQTEIENGEDPPRELLSEDSSDAEERLLNSYLPKALKSPKTDKTDKMETNGKNSPGAVKKITLERKSSSSPDCVKIRKLLSGKKPTPEKVVSTPSAESRSSRSPRSEGRSMEQKAALIKPDASKWERNDDLPAAYRLDDRPRVESRSRSRSKSRSVSGSRSRSASYERSHSRESASVSHRSDSRRRSYSHSSYTSRSRSRSRSRSSRRYDSRSRSRSASSRSRSRSPSIPRRSGSPSFLDKRRITSARKRPVPYDRYRGQSHSSCSSDDYRK